MNQKKDRNKYVNAERMDQNRRYKQKFDQHKLGMQVRWKSCCLVEGT